MSDVQIFDQNLTGIANTAVPGAWSASSLGTLQYAAPVYIAGPAIVDNAFAGGAAALAQCVGLSLRECDVAGAPTYVSPMTGPVDFPKAQWDAVTGTAPVDGQPVGLTTGAAYYLSATTAGRLTTTAPFEGGDFIILIGVARDPTTMILNIQTLGNQVPAPAPITE